MIKSLKAAVVLSGSGFMDGSEIGESILALTALTKHGVKYSCFAPIKEFEVIDHVSGKPTGEKRSAFVEAARISRGKISPLKDLKVEDFDILVMPGGFGVAKTLSNIAFTNTPSVIQDLGEIILGFFEASKPIGCICVSPIAVVSVLGKVTKPTVTVGRDGDQVIRCGGMHVETDDSSKFVVDSKNKVYSCAAYMNSDTNLHSVFIGIDSMIGAIVSDLSQ